MGPYDTAALRHRQELGTAGLSASTRAEQRRDGVVIAVLLILGLLLAYASPLPGLGAFVIAGAAMATPVLALHIWLGG